ncbi:MAG: hypothetical protein KKE57_08625 [Proteobacteria bacterium]|nr:hypothetical protein [Pseudomonadota bacterium]
MEKEIGKICAEGLAFFGITNRLISHELKNILAIISETLGLIDELIKSSQTGLDLKPGQLSSLSESVIEEIERANSIIRNMNTFAHSVDEFMGEVDISRILSLMIGICRLNSASKNTKLRLVDNGPCVIYTSPLFLQKLLYQVINFSLPFVSPQHEIKVSFDSDDHGARIIFSGISCNNIKELNEKEAWLAKMLSAKVFLDATAGELSIALPKRIGESPLQSLISEWQ